MKKNKNFVIDSRGIRIPVDENKDCPGCREVAPAVEKHPNWSAALMSITEALDSLENFLYEDRSDIPSPDVLAVLQDRYDQLGEKLWLKATKEWDESPVSLMQEITESSTATEDNSAME